MNGIAYKSWGLLLAAMCFVSGCTSLRVPSVSTGLLTERVILNLNDCSLDLSELRPANRHAEDARSFMSTLELMTRVNLEEADPDGINIAAIRIRCRPRIGTGGPVLLSIISTPIPIPFSFIRNRCSARVVVSYAIADADGEVVEEHTLEQIIRGGYSGWSFVRFAFRGAVASRVREPVPRLAAEMLIEDLRSRGKARRTNDEKGDPAKSGLKIITGTGQEIR